MVNGAGHPNHFLLENGGWRKQMEVSVVCEMESSVPGSTASRFALLGRTSLPPWPSWPQRSHQLAVAARAPHHHSGLS